MKEMFGKITDALQRYSLDERRLNHLQQYLTSACMRVFGPRYEGNREELIRGVRSTSDGRLAYDVVILFKDKEGKENGKVTGISGYRPRWGLGTGFARGRTWGSPVIDISDEMPVQAATSRICRHLRGNDFLRSLKRY